MANKIISTLVFSLITVLAFGQGDSLEGLFFQSAKFYVVLAVIGVILLGIVLYLVRLERRIGKMEEQVEDSNK